MTNIPFPDLALQPCPARCWSRRRGRSTAGTGDWALAWRRRPTKPSGTRRTGARRKDRPGRFHCRLSRIRAMVFAADGWQVDYRSTTDESHQWTAAIYLPPGFSEEPDHNAPANVDHRPAFWVVEGLVEEFSKKEDWMEVWKLIAGCSKNGFHFTSQKGSF